MEITRDILTLEDEGHHTFAGPRRTEVGSYAYLPALSDKDGAQVRFELGGRTVMLSENTQHEKPALLVTIDGTDVALLGSTDELAEGPVRTEIEACIEAVVARRAWLARWRP